MTVADPGFSLGEGAPTPKVGVLTYFLSKCMQMKEFRPQGQGGSCIPGAPFMAHTHCTGPGQRQGPW